MNPNPATLEEIQALIAKIDDIKFPAPSSLENPSYIANVEQALNRLRTRYNVSVPAWRRK